MHTTNFDLIVVGGGPAGATVATLVAMAGHRVLLLERESFPRHQVGESLLPATIQDVTTLLGIREQVRNAGFPIKRGATFSWGSDAELWNMHFGGPAADGHSLDGVPFAHNVPRAEFDALLLDNAVARGVDVRQNHAVVAALTDGDRVTGVEYIDDQGKRHTATARFVADASGHQSRLAAHVGRRVYSKFYRNVGAYGYYLGGKRLPAPRQGNVLFEAFDRGWVWYIPMDDNLTSVGAVIPKQFARDLLDNPEAGLRQILSSLPLMRDMLDEARPAEQPPYAGVRVRKEFSYCHSRLWSNGLLLLGDAACFVDVLLSSGVHIATYSGLLAARSINTLLSGDLDETRCMDAFELRTRMEFTRFYHCLIGLYDMRRDTAAYQAWLRLYLRTTNGVFLDMTEARADPSCTAPPMMGEQVAGPCTVAARMDVDTLRRIDEELLEYDGPPSMDVVSAMPPIETDVQPSTDGLHWSEC